MMLTKMHKMVAANWIRTAAKRISVFRSVISIHNSFSAAVSNPLLPKSEKIHTTAATNSPIQSAAASEPIQHAVLSIFDLFSIGIGPSSSHTVGPMRAAKIFVSDLSALGVLKNVDQLRIDLYGSLALTGVGHGTPNAILMGLEGETPEAIPTTDIIPRVEQIYATHQLKLGGSQTDPTESETKNNPHIIKFVPEKHLVFHFREALPYHPNGMRFSAYDVNGDLIATNEFFSIGGGFVVNGETKLSNVFYKDDRVDHAEKVDLGPTTATNRVGDELRSVTNPSTPHHVHPIMPTSSQSPPQPMPSPSSKQVMAALPFHDAASLLRLCDTQNLTIAQIVFRNELQWRSSDQIVARTLHLWHVMEQSILNGMLSSQEFLPGNLKVRRRAPALYKRLVAGMAEYAGFGGGWQINGTQPREVQGTSQVTTTKTDPHASISDSASKNTKTVDRFAMSSTGGRGVSLIRPHRRSLPALDWLSLYAIAVNEENAAGGRVVTAPTNGSAGTLPSVLKYYLDFICPSPMQRDHDIVEFLLTAAAIGMLYKRCASISAAEMGCQGEVGVSCSMAAAALTSVLGGTPDQVENAAEIAMEHNLGLTCDPPMGLVVIPCIERNALAAVKAVTAAQLALNGDGTHRVTLDQVIATMRQTGIDMMSKYKETSEGGLAVNVPIC